MFGDFTVKSKIQFQLSVNILMVYHQAKYFPILSMDKKEAIV